MRQLDKPPQAGQPAAPAPIYDLLSSHPHPQLWELCHTRMLFYAHKEGEIVSAIKRALEEIMFCDFCGGTGWQGWVSEDDFSYEPCECNPNRFEIREF